MAAKKITPVIGISGLTSKEENGCLVARGRCILKISGSREKPDTSLIRVDMPCRENAAEITFGSRYGTPLPGGYRLNSFTLKIDMQSVKDLDIQNKLIPVYKGEYRGSFLYDVLDRHRGRNKNSTIFLKDGKAIYLRQTPVNTLYLTVREQNIYDTEEGQRRLREAEKKAAALRGKDIILMYEKNCSRYEESASVLYEKLIDAGFKNVYYIVDMSIPAVRDLKPEYRRNLIQKDSDRHLQYFFACSKFISSETIDHALQLRIASKSVLDKINGKGISYVFLQHGVMYMVSLNSGLRTGFRKKEGYALHKTVVSSEAEARHFIELGGMERDDLYITGLAKFDTCRRNDGADRIIIMPTWRRWESNQAEEDVTQTGYYRMLCTMYDGVPDDLKDKVIILPHPLIAEKFSGSEDGGMAGHVMLADSYDRVLRDCSLLITDYSSIAYDAFYRGANVVFYWKDTDECMEHYGEGTHLMLNDENVFGPVCMNADDICKAVTQYYNMPQREDHLSVFREIVEFHDGRNSERIIEKLKEDGMIR